MKALVKKLKIRASIEEKDFDEVEEEIKAATSTELIVFEPMRGKAPEKNVDITAEF